MAEPVLPLLLKANPGWLGNDGNWSTFTVGVGNPKQFFNVLPSTSAGEVWVPLPQGCSTLIPNCTASRGVVSSQSGGFQSNESSTWEQIGTGIYALGFENNLFGEGDNGLYGQDAVSIAGATYNISDQTVAGIASANIWLGSLGLGVQGSQFGSSNMPTLLSTLKTMNLTSSQSYGYAVGAFYRSSPGSLVIGGFDQSAFANSNISRPVSYSGARSLTVNLRSVLADNTLQGSSTLPIDAGGLNMSIDSTVSQMWLPESVCDAIAVALGLTYDNSSELYLVNSTTHSQLIQKAPAFTFTLAADGSTSETINIKIPWAALDFAYGEPMYSENTPYFPMRRAANATQYVLGRAFLQEAYIAVDWERMDFTIGQTSHATGASNNIVPIVAPSAGADPPAAPKSTGGTDQTSSSGPGAGLFAGIAVGVVAAIASTCGAAWYFWRRRRQQQTISPSLGTVEYFFDDRVPKRAQEFIQEVPGSPAPPGYKERASPKPEMYQSAIHELQGELRHQLMSTPVYELAGEVAGHELEDDDHHKTDGFPFPPDAIGQAGRAP